MSRKNECKIVQDLLPNYVEGLTNEETNLFIEEHLRECNTCKKMFNNMKTEIQKPDKEVNKNEVNYIKKYNIKLKTLKIIIIIILIIFITILGRKTIILLSLSEKAKENQSYDNYYIKLNSYQGDYFITTEIYNKGEDYLRTWTRFSTDTQEIQKMIYYKKGNDQILLQEIGENKYIKKSFIEGQIYPVTYIPTNLKDKIESIIFLNINSTYFSVISTSCNGKKCYLIKDNEVVVTKYKKGNKKEGYYDIPGGKIEEGESPKQTAIREMKEETGIEIQNLKYKGIMTIEYPDRLFIFDTFITKEYEGELQEFEENTSEWIDIDELLKKEKILSNIILLDKFLIKGLIDDNRNFNLHIKVDEQENILGIDYNLEKIINKK